MVLEIVGEVEGSEVVGEIDGEARWREVFGEGGGAEVEVAAAKTFSCPPPHQG